MAEVMSPIAVERTISLGDLLRCALPCPCCEHGDFEMINACDCGSEESFERVSRPESDGGASPAGPESDGGASPESPAQSPILSDAAGTGAAGEVTTACEEEQATAACEEELEEEPQVDEEDNYDEDDYDDSNLDDLDPAFARALDLGEAHENRGRLYNYKRSGATTRSTGFDCLLPASPFVSWLLCLCRFCLS